MSEVKYYLLDHIKNLKSAIVIKLAESTDEIEFKESLQTYTTLTVLEDAVVMGKIDNGSIEGTDFDSIKEAADKQVDIGLKAIVDMDLSNTSSIEDCTREANLRISEHIMFMTIFTEGLDDIADEYGGMSNVPEDVIDATIDQNMKKMRAVEDMGIPFLSTEYAGLLQDILDMHGCTYSEYIAYKGEPPISI